MTLLYSQALSFDYRDLSERFDKRKQVVTNKLNLSGYQKFYRSNSPAFLVDQVFENGEKLVFLKIGLKSESDYQKKFISFRDGYIYNFNHSGIPISLYFKNLNQIQRLKVIKQVRSFLSLKKFSIFQLLFPKAYAQDCVNTLEPIVNLENIQRPVEKFNQDYLLSQASSCVQKALGAVWERTGGLVSDIGEGVWNFIKSPIKSSKEFWNKSIDTYEVTKKFISNIENEMKNLGHALGGLSTESQIQLACSLAGNLGGSVLLSVITGGAAGLANGVVALQQNTAKLIKSSSVIKLLDRLKLEGRLSKEKLSQLLDKIILTKNKEGLTKVNRLSQANMSKLTLEYASCAL